MAEFPFAIVDVRLALGSGEALRAYALETVDTVRATTLVFAGIRIAVVDLVLAINPAVTGRTGAFVSAAGLRTLSAVLAGLIDAGLSGIFAERAVKPARTNARMVGGIRVSRAGAAVRARRFQTVVDQILAFRAGESFRTFTGITTLSGVEARAPVAAGFVIRAEVEVLITKKSAPSLVAHAIPRFHATAVNASGIPLALIAERSFPSRLTSINK